MSFEAARSHHEILVVDPAAHTPETDCFNHIARLASSRTSYHLPGLCGLSTLRQANQRASQGAMKVAGIIVLGSATSVHDRLPWQTELVDWLRPHLERGIPMFGFCFGHQMLAAMYGAEVGFVREDQEKLKGFHPIEVKKSRLAPEGVRSLLRSHREEVKNIPAGFHLMATSGEVPVDGLEHDSLPIWSLQTHPEATTDFLVSQGIDPAGAPPVTAPEASPRLKDGWDLVQRFLRHCAG